GELYRDIFGAATLAELEDIYSPFKKKKKTRGMLAIEKGLEGLAQAMRELETEPLRALAAKFVKPLDGLEPPELSVASVDDALQGAMDIIAEAVYRDPENRAQIKAFYLKDGKISAKGSGVEGKGDAEAQKTSVYRMYWDFSEAFSHIKPHRILAINRAEREGVLAVTVDVDENAAVLMLQNKYTLHNEYHKTAIEDCVKRLLSPALIREIRGDQSDAADTHGIGVFSENLKNLLLQQPIKGTRVMGIDPGIRTGTKCAFLDDTGKYLGNIVIFNNKAEEAKQLIFKSIREYDVQLIAVGNGTGSHEVQEIITSLIAENNLEIFFTVVDEDGASVYSASDIAREEFPDLDLTIRGAVSIGRRLQDPLAELVKIDPKSLGVGLYQHDVNQKKLSATLDEVVSSVVNNVGVTLNTASASLLKYVSGINGSLARNIVAYRNEKGRISSRQELSSVPGMGPKSFEQCAGFLKIPESGEPLDNTWVHPENYPVAREIRQALTATTSTSGGSGASGSGGASDVSGAPTGKITLSTETITALKEKFGAGETTILDIAGELKKPNQDPRSDYPKPIMRKGIVSFEDLHEGMMITGKIKNVVDFGAFVDLGIKETALVHISEMGDRFIRDPLETVKAGDVMEFKIISLDADQRRIGLSRKGLQKPAPAPASQSASTAQSAPPSQAASAQRPERNKPMRPPRRKEFAHTAQPAQVTQSADKPADAAQRQGPVSPQHGNAPYRDGSRPPRGDNQPRRDGNAQRGGNALYRGNNAPHEGNAPRRDGRQERDAGRRNYEPLSQGEQDGTMYRPFADLLKKMQDKK
ncbi:MAG: helix-hairpin-helix domain-containing protein, partial [Treponema sp.]|nr:helix-hairpin-helix domain-containing protein [Treponema sp.]